MDYVQKKIFVAGHKGMLGSSILKELRNMGCTNLITKTRQELDLLDTHQVNEFMATEKPQIVILAAAKVGGIQYNISYPSEFLYENLQIQNNVIWSSFRNNVEKFVFLGSSCIYPKNSPQPMKEEYLLTGPLEPTNEGYAIAKIAGIKLVEYLNRQYGFPGISIMPCNLYGPNDSFDLNHSHVLSALVKRFSDARKNNISSITLWGSGKARREFMYSEDCARGIVYLMDKQFPSSFINLGWGEDISIKDLADMIAQKCGFQGEIIWDLSKPDGIMRKCMDVSKMQNLGFSPSITLEEGIESMIKIYNNSNNQN